MYTITTDENGREVTVCETDDLRTAADQWSTWRYWPECAAMDLYDQYRDAPELGDAFDGRTWAVTMRDDHGVGSQVHVDGREWVRRRAAQDGAGDDLYAFLTIQEAAGMLGMSRSGVRKWIREGKIAGYKAPGTNTTVYLRRVDVLAALETMDPRMRRVGE